MIQSELIPHYGSDRLTTIGTNSQKDTRLAALISRETALTFPIVLNLERTVYIIRSNPLAPSFPCMSLLKAKSYTATMDLDLPSRKKPSIVCLGPPVNRSYTFTGSILSCAMVQPFS